MKKKTPSKNHSAKGVKLNVKNAGNFSKKKGPAAHQTHGNVSKKHK